MLCKLCQDIRLAELIAFETDFDDEIERCQFMSAEKAYRHQPNFEALCISGQNQCDLCLLVSQILEEDQTWNDDDEIYGSTRGESASDLVHKLRTDCSAQIYICRVDGTERQDDAGIFEVAIIPTFIYDSPESRTNLASRDAFFWRALEVWTQNGERLCDMNGYAHRRLITRDPLSITATSIFKNWFSACQNSHPKCSTNTKHAMPRRVIDVGPSNGSQSPRLHQSCGKKGQWATLSHCWGKTVTTKLTLATLEEKMQGISMAALPQNFRDAIIVTRFLGVQYLWIDSLCIIQDSTEDWLQESAKMGEIYKDSLITIAATNAKESTAGFLQNRKAEIQCHLQQDDGVKLPVCIRERIEWYGFAEIVGPLTQRAWVLQERLLSPRILHFGGQQIMWQCQTKTLAEGFCDTDRMLEEQVPGAIESMLRTEFHAAIENPLNEESNVLTKAKPTESLPQEPLVVPSKIYPTRDNIYGQWYHLVGMYARLKLTKNTDRLPAIAGIARQVQIRTGDTYLSGIWKSDIRLGLQWWYSPPSVMVRPPIPRAPSWSWAALDLITEESSAQLSENVVLSATYASRDRSYEYEVQLLEYSPSLTANGCLGSVSGAITLLGLWNEAKFAPARDLPPGRFNLSYPTPLELKGQSGVRAAARLDIDEKQIHTAEIGCLQMGKFQYIGPKHPTQEYVSALLLQRVCHGEETSTQHIRVGLVVLLDTCDALRGWEKRAVDVI